MNKSFQQVFSFAKDMHMYIKALAKVASRYAPSRTLSFNIVHVFAALQLIQNRGRASRDTLCKELALGEGTVKTLVKHMKMHGLIETSNGGTKMTAKGRGICSELLETIAEASLPKCAVALGRFNYAVRVREFGFAVRSGIEQRDAAIKMGATGATTLLYKDSKFVMPASSGQDSLKKEPEVRRLMIEKLEPEEGDVVIIGSADSDGKTAELAAKNAALLTILSHEKHHH